MPDNKMNRLNLTQFELLPRLPFLLHINLTLYILPIQLLLYALLRYVYPSMLGTGVFRGGAAQSSLMGNFGGLMRFSAAVYK